MVIWPVITNQPPSIRMVRVATFPRKLKIGIIAAKALRIFMPTARAWSAASLKRSSSRAVVLTSRTRAAPTMFSLSTRFIRSVMPMIWPNSLRTRAMSMKKLTPIRGNTGRIARASFQLSQSRRPLAAMMMKTDEISAGAAWATKPLMASMSEVKLVKSLAVVCASIWA